jgi:hypothetical protein
VRKLVLVGALLALLFGPRLAVHDAIHASASTLSAAVLGPTTTDHDSITTSVDTAKRTIALAMAVLVAVLVVLAGRGWRPIRRAVDHGWVTWRGQQHRRRGPPLLPV